MFSDLYLTGQGLASLSHHGKCRRGRDHRQVRVSPDGADLGQVAASPSSASLSQILS